jgi:uncharacterized membrane protein YhaH (DUF805 family)
MDWYIATLRKCLDFEGRARRKEYWMFSLINGVIVFVLAGSLIMGIYLRSSHGKSDVPWNFTVFAFLTLFFSVFFLSLAVTVRRLHDVGLSGWWYFISLVPSFGGICLLIFTLLDSTPRPNAYGPNPKDPEGLSGLPQWPPVE